MNVLQLLLLKQEFRETTYFVQNTRDPVKCYYQEFS